MTDRHPIGWTMAGLVIVGAAVGYVAALIAFPVTTGVLTSYALIAWWSSYLTGRNLRAELEAVRVRLSTYNGSETHAALAEVGPATPPRGAVELFDQDALAELRGRAPDYAGWADGISVDPTVEHLGQACAWSDGDTDCGDPSVGYVEMLIGHPVPVCESHYQWACHSEDDDHETLPRVLPEGRISD